MAMELAGQDGSDAIAGASAAAERARSQAAARGLFFGGGSGGGGSGGGGGGGGGVAPPLPFLPPGTEGDGGGSDPLPGMCPVGGGRGPQVASASYGSDDSEMALSSAGEAWLKDVEKLALQPYDDQKGIAAGPITEWVEGATIGYGHLILADQWNTYKSGITEEEAEALFWVDAQPFIDAVNQAITVDMEPHEFDAMVILAFNIGEEGFKTSSVAKLVNDPGAHTPYGSLEGAWKAWNKSQGEVNQGLINRRAAEWDMYSQGVYRHW